MTHAEVGVTDGRVLADLLERAVLELMTAGRAPVERLQQEAPLHLEEPSRHEVVEHTHALEEGDVLEGAGDAERGDVGRLEVRPVLAVEDDPSLVRMVEATDRVEQRRLAGAVGTDDRQDLAATDPQAHLVQRHERAEADADARHLEERARVGSRHGLTESPGTATSRILTSARIVPVRPSS